MGGDRANRDRVEIMSDILKRHATENFFDRTWNNFEERLERGAFAHTAFPGWLLIRSSCTDCDDDVTVIKYKGRRIQLVPSGDEQMGRRWVVHQCDNPTKYEIGPDEGHPEPEYGERDDILEARHEARGEVYPDDPNVRDGNGDIVARFDWDD